MKTKLIYYLIVCCFGCSIQVKAQNNYSFSVGNYTYQDLVNPTIIHGSDSIASAYFVNCDMQFPALGAHVDFRLNSSVPSLGAYVTRAGYLAVYESPGYEHTYAFHGYYFPGLQKRDSNSSISFELTGSTGNKLLKFQWKNMGFLNHGSDEFVNFQIWFDEATETVTYHYGPSNLVWDSQEVAVINLFRAPNDFSSFTHATCLTGDAAVPASLTAVHPLKFEELMGTIHFPPSGTTITFLQSISGIKKEGMDPLFEAFPNPFHAFVQIQCKGDFNWELTDLMGKTIHKGKGSDDVQIDTRDLMSQVYLLKLEQQGKVEIQKLIR